jgi:capsular exopolysaccharide synthesis family protein
LQAYSDTELNLRDLLTVLFRYKLLFFVTFVTIIIPVYIMLEMRTPVYNANVTILVAGKMQKDVEVQRDLGPGSLVATQMALVRSSPIIQRTVKALKLYERPLNYEKKYATKIKAAILERNLEEVKLSLEDMTKEQQLTFFFRRAVNNLVRSVSTSPLGETSLFNISVNDFDRVAAGRIANVLSRSYIIFDLEQQIAELKLIYGEKNITINKLRKHIESIEETLDGRLLPDIEAIGPGTVKIISQAGIGIPIEMKPGKLSALIVACIMSIVSGIVLSFGFYYFEQTFRSPKDVETFLKIPLLGSIPKIRSRKKLLLKATNPTKTYKQAHQRISDQIYLMTQDEHLKAILITGFNSPQETIIVSTNLSIYLNSRGCNVLFIDANIKSPSISKVFNISNSPGFTDVLEGKIAIEDAVQKLDSHLTVLSAGETVADPITLLGSSIMSNVMNTVKDKYEIVFISGDLDIKNLADTVKLASGSDGIVLIVNEGKTRRHTVKSIISPMEQNGIKIIGSILNNRTYYIPKIIYKLT